MFLARIDGTVTSTIKHSTLEGYRLLVGQRIEGNGAVSGEPLIFVDLVGARHGSTVMVTTDNEPLRAVKGNTAPARLVIVGIVDMVAGEAK
jgi:ethanolamine utilization protein EutN